MKKHRRAPYKRRRTPDKVWTKKCIDETIEHHSQTERILKERLRGSAVPHPCSVCPGKATMDGSEGHCMLSFVRDTAKSITDERYPEVWEKTASLELLKELAYEYCLDPLYVSLMEVKEADNGDEKDDNG
jgi:hypothetical protein